MIPVVDCNWHPDVMNSDSAGVHVLKCVYIQPKMTASAAVDDLEKVREFALTPGSGGLPQGIVAWCDLSSQSIERLTSISFVRGLNISAGTTESLNLCLDAVKSTNQSLDLEFCATDAEQVSRTLSKFPDVPVVLDINKFGFRDRPLVMTHFRQVLEPFRHLENVNVKITGIGPVAESDPEFTSSDRVKEVVDAWGPDRVLLASHSVTGDAGISFDQLWMLYGQGTRHLSARERESVLRSNAISVYRL